jgi:hypothetical protein
MKHNKLCRHIGLSWMVCLAITSTAVAQEMPLSNPDDVFWDNKFAVPGLGSGINNVTAGNGKVYFTDTRIKLPQADGTFLNYAFGVGGSFPVAGGSPAGFIAKWNPTNEQWAPLGPPLDNVVRSIGTFVNDVYAAGDFVKSGADTVIKSPDGMEVGRFSTAAQ